MAKNPLVSIVSVNWNKPEITMDMVKSFQYVTYSNYELIIVDNGSTVGDIDPVKYYPNVKLIKTGKKPWICRWNKCGYSSFKGALCIIAQ